MKFLRCISATNITIQDQEENVKNFFENVHIVKMRNGFFTNNKNENQCCNLLTRFEILVLKCEILCDKIFKITRGGVVSKEISPFSYAEEDEILQGGAWKSLDLPESATVISGAQGAAGRGSGKFRKDFLRAIRPDQREIRRDPSMASWPH